ncbi:MAG: 3-oxoacyl-ACP synthase III [Pirellulales bacterium]|nr:3-oxoacyl-ACP synthase III [Pirellulales bacterium]
MRYQRVHLAGLGYTLPEERIASESIEARLAPAYQRLKLPAGRLELMTGIRERRFFPPGTLIGTISVESGRKALAAAGIDPAEIGALVHGSVCRDYLEPATACGVHHALGLPPECAIFDVSNACLGILTGMTLVANMIELGQIRAGLVVGTEDGRSLVENTIHRLNTDHSLKRRDVKPLVASLTIGSASAAAVLSDSSFAPRASRLLGGAVRAHTTHNDLCQSSGLETFMHTDSELLLREGVAAGQATFGEFLSEVGWERGDIDRTICHQVGIAHRKLLFEQLELDSTIDYSTFEMLGNTGAAALPSALAMAAEAGFLQEGQHVALLGIGSGINCQMLGVEWR